MASAPAASATRTDIQALRGVAVAAVVLYHARADWFAAGYLGVDIFFVISGFLITGMVREAIERGEFRFGAFYFRRAKRLLPAAYVVFAAAAALAPFVLGAAEQRDFAAQTAGALTFTANAVLWQQSGYFQGAAELKPLLHVWSLSLEEQYYLILPATLVLIPPRFWLRGALAIVAASLALWVLGAVHKPIATFYLLPARAWELGLGSLGALIARDHWLRGAARASALPALALVLAVPAAPVAFAHPGASALVVCVATLAVILARHRWCNETAPARALARLGDFSYSLYLVHWPIFAFANNAWAGTPAGELPAAARAAAVALSIALGYALYRWVERPVRRAPFPYSRRVLAGTLAASAAIAVFAAWPARVPGSRIDYADVRRMNFGFDAACETKGAFAADPKCRNAAAPYYLVWGDSYAMHLVPGLAATAAPRGVEQATSSVCGPLLGLAPVARTQRSGIDRNEAWAAGCIAFNRSVVEHLAATPSIEVVVLATSFRQYLIPGDFRLVAERAGTLEPVEADAAAAAMVDGIRSTAQAVRALGRRIVVVAPPPSADFDIGACLERRTEGKARFGAPDDCEIPIADYRRLRGRVLEQLARLPREAGVEVLSFDAELCGERSCRTLLDGTFVYRDDGHFSVAGSRAVAERLGLASRLDALAK